MPIPDFKDKPEGGSFSIDLVATYLTKTVVGSPTYSIVGSLPTGWSLNGSGVLSYNGTGQGLTSIQVKAVLAGQIDAVSNTFIVSSVAAGGGDTTAPTIPTGTEAVVVGGVGVTVSCDPASDPEGNLATYRLYRDNVFVHAVNAPNGGLQSTLAHSVLGVGGSTSRSGNDYTITSAGDGFGGATDSGEFSSIAVSGDFELVCKAISVTGGSTNSHVALHVRESTSVDAKMAVLAVNGIRTRMRYRSTANTNAVIAGSVDGQLAPVWIKLVRAGSTFTSFYSTTGRSWIQFAQATVAMQSACLAGILVGNGGTGTTVTASVQQFKISSSPAISYNDPVTDGVSHTWQYTAKDASNESAKSTGVTATASGTPDVINPTVPTGLTGSGPSSSTVSWVWVASTDASGIRGYIPSLSTDNVSFTPQTEQTSTTFGVSGLSASTTRYLKVEAIDNAGNHSGFTSSVSAASAASGGADTTAPAAPTNCAAAAISTTQLQISCTLPTDPSGISGVKLYVSTSATGSYTPRQQSVFPTVPFNDTVGIPNTTVFYQLTAVDGAGNESVRSAVFSGTTQTSAGLTITLLHFDDMQGAYDASKPSVPGSGSKTWQIGDDYDLNSGNPILDYSTDYARVGTKSAKSELRITSSPTTWYHANTSETPFRSEWNSNAGAVWPVTGWNRQQAQFTQANQTEYWCGISILLPPDYKVDATHPSFAIVAQWHGSGADGSDIRNPMMSLSTSGLDPATGLKNQWFISNLSQKTLNDPTKVYDKPNMTYSLGPVAPDRGHWVDWVFRTRWDSQFVNNKQDGTSKGILQVWKNDVLVVNQINVANSFNNTNVGYPLPIGFYIERVNWTTNPNPSTIAPGMPATMIGYWGWWRYVKVVGNPQASVDSSNPGYQAVKAPGTRPV